MTADNGYQHEQAVIMTQIAKYKVDPASYLGGRDTDKEYLRKILFAPTAFFPQTAHRKELSDRLGSGTYQPRNSFSSLYSNPNLYESLGKYN